LIQNKSDRPLGKLVNSTIPAHKINRAQSFRLEFVGKFI